jgi:thiamine-phosphate pyrophosphorylase
MNPRLRGLYAITPDGLALPALLAAVDAVLAGGARLLQLRRKATPGEHIEAEASALLGLCRRHSVPLIVNDDPTLAARIGADGVHLGRDDCGIGQARRLLGSKALIGVSCYDSLARAEAAQATGADYVAFGSVLASSRKPQAPRASPELLQQACRRLSLPVCAIGGIRRPAAPALLATGVSMLAVIGDLFDDDDPGAAAAGYRRLFEPPSA